MIPISVNSLCNGYRRMTDKNSVIPTVRNNEKSQCLYRILLLTDANVRSRLIRYKRILLVRQNGWGEKHAIVTVLLRFSHLYTYVGNVQYVIELDLRVAIVASIWSRRLVDGSGGRSSYGLAFLVGYERLIMPTWRAFESSDKPSAEIAILESAARELLCSRSVSVETVKSFLVSGALGCLSHSLSLSSPWASRRFLELSPIRFIQKLSESLKITIHFVVWYLHEWQITDFLCEIR